MSDVARLARILGVEQVRVRSALASADRRSEPDAREVYGLIEDSCGRPRVHVVAVASLATKGCVSRG
jgi:hypothetical protein